MEVHLFLWNVYGLNQRGKTIAIKCYSISFDKNEGSNEDKDDVCFSDDEKVGLSYWKLWWCDVRFGVNKLERSVTNISTEF